MTVPAPPPPPRQYAGPEPIRARTIRAGRDIFKPGDVVQSHGRPYEIISVYRQAADFTDYLVEPVAEPRLLPERQPSNFRLPFQYLGRLFGCMRSCL